MSVVSSKLGVFNIGRTRHVPIAVQYVKNDTDTPEPPDYTQGAQLPTFNLSKRIRLPAVNLVPEHKGEFVPLKCDQQNTHAFGAALFNAPTPAFTPQLDIESDVPFPTATFSNAGIAKFPDLAPRFPYEAGIRGNHNPIKFDDVGEPAGASFRKGVAEHRYAPAHISYDLGVDELRSMMRR